MPHDPGGPPQRPQGGVGSPVPLGCAEGAATAKTLNALRVFFDRQSGQATAGSFDIDRCSRSNVDPHDSQAYS
jgi:hypothetical protein